MTERLLKLAGPIHVIGGLLLFAIGFSPAALAHLESMLVGNDHYAWSAFFAAVLGPTIASWGVLFSALVNQFYASPSRTLWRAMALSVAIWAPLDTALCLKYGVTVGAVVNASIVIVLAGLLISARHRVR